LNFVTSIIPEAVLYFFNTTTLPHIHTIHATVIIPLNSMYKLSFVKEEIKVFREVGIEFLHY
jgi:hypothetical protein